MKDKKFTKRIAKYCIECMGLERGIIDTSEGIEKFLFVCRNFNVGNRVNLYYKGKFFTGTIVKKEKIKPISEPYLYIKTDKKVGKDCELYNGYGLKGPAYSRDPLFFIWEKLPEGNEIFRTIVERHLTKKELKREREYFGDIPF